MLTAPQSASSRHRLSLVGLLIAATTLLCSNEALAQGWVVETAFATGNVGQHASIALDVQGNPHVSYLFDTALAYSRKTSGVWMIDLVDLSATVGFYTSLALDASGNPHLSYLDDSNDNLKYARKSGGLWTIETADGSANDVGRFSSLALDASGNPHVSYWDQSTLDLKYASKSGGVWTREIADGSANNVGWYTSLVLDASGNPHVSYYDATTGDLKYARKSGGVWTRETADGSANNVGQYTSLALDASGNPHVSYQDGTAFDLKYAWKSGGVWMNEIADASGLFLGYNTSLALDAMGNSHVSHQDQSAGSSGLKYARKMGGTWTHEWADVGNQGFFPSLALDVSGKPHVCYHDATSADLRYAYMPGQIITSPQPGVTWPVGSQQTIAWSVSGGLPVGDSDIYLSVDGGNSFALIRDQAHDFEATIRVPHTPTRFAAIKVIRPSPNTVAYMDSFFTIDATIALAKFDATRSEDGTRLTWETLPGPEADIRYRVERGSGGAFISIAGGLDRAEYVDPQPVTASRYRLIAINGLGEEYVLGETSVTGALAADRNLAAYPNPAGGAVQILYRIPFDQPVDLAIYDLSGRRVRSLVSSRQPVGVQSVTWDRRDDAGRDVAAGTYFARLTSGDGFRAAERVTIVR